MKKILDDESFMARLTELFVAEGMSSLTVGTIAERMRCSRRRLYQLADSKEKLFALVVRRRFDDTLRQGSTLGPESEIGLARALAEYLKLGVRAGSNLSPAYQNDVEANPETKRIFDQYQAARAAKAEQMIAAGVAAGVFVPCHAALVAEVLRAAGRTLRQPRFLGSVGMTMDQAFDEFYRVILGGLLNRPDAGTESASKPAPARQDGPHKPPTTERAPARARPKKAGGR